VIKNCYKYENLLDFNFYLYNSIIKFLFITENIKQIRFKPKEFKNFIL